MKNRSAPPQADQRPHLLMAHGDKRQDEYFWLREKENAKVVQYLQEENNYFDQFMESQQQIKKDIISELKSYIEEDDQTVPYKLGKYSYYAKYFKGLQYPIRYRSHIETGTEEVVLDENKWAQRSTYFHLGLYKISPTGKYAAFSVDEDGSEKFTIYIKDLETGFILVDQIRGAYYSLAWKKDSTGFYYNSLDEFGRPDRVLYHKLGTETYDDELIYKEQDPTFFVHTWLSRDQEIIFISSKGAVTTEFSYLKSDQKPSPPLLIRERTEGIEYTVDHRDSQFYVLINDIEPNNRVISFSHDIDLNSCRDDQISEWICGDSELFIESFYVFKGYLVVHQSRKGKPSFLILRFDEGAPQIIEFDEPTYVLKAAANPDFDSEFFRFIFSSPLTPRTIYDCSALSQNMKVVKKQHINNFDPSLYVTDLLYFKSSDGTEVPVSIVAPKDLYKKVAIPSYVTAYGAYGNSMTPDFSIKHLSLLKKGFLVAIAHCRGGSELGRTWYESGKYMLKKNTFYDFIAVCEGLKSSQLAQPDGLIISGESAGGMLMGVCTNWRPDLFKAVIAHVPFVDVLTTMLDPTLPLTTIEYDEWGNPEIKAFYDYIKSYSPYDNIKAQRYPNMFITAGFNDPRVTYWEPAKFVARLRRYKRDQNILLLKTNMGAGHSGASGRYDALSEAAEDIAFIVKIFN